MGFSDVYACNPFPSAAFVTQRFFVPINLAHTQKVSWLHGHENAGLHHKTFIQHAKLLAIAQLTYRINLKTKQLQIKFCSMAALVFSLEDLESVVPEVLGVD
ncbi:E5 [Kappapapillomavirus 2]|uniref:Probable protein E5 n=2 Tax=Kappapapillomavirus 2 TaxID=10623 RepID=VE5_CRPVK|nr:E5 [Kappapapillomavirus 2]P03125.1 RecName: Full=Probable protein E5 [Papillomavirus sylvilagi (STRAIN KANSAS)]pir/W5WLRB/ E5 protein - cottontail rabbit papillomavirus [Kappapapillomavirus 2]CAB96167.1 e5 [Kappapapillomavirus 2]